ncbi:MAG TPA: tetratricopeptide repeat protein [Spirillospora sp.]|nr:tetratricopeptide repeat protein [Spirillospora sp.]
MKHSHDRKPPAQTRHAADAQSSHARPFATDPQTTPVLNLQKLIGNQAVQRLFRPGTADSQMTVPRIAPLRTSTPHISREEENVEAAREHFEEGQRLFRAGRYQAAIIRLERARQIPGLDADIYTTLLYNLGVCNLRLERFATAVNYFEQYLARPGADAEEVEPLLEQARQGTAADAETIMNRQGGSLPPPSSDPAAQADSARTLFEQAAALYEAGQYRQAIIIFEQVREMEITDNAEAIRAACLFNIGRCNVRLGRHATAIIYLEQYIDVAPSEADRQEAEAMLVEAQENAGALTSVEQAQMMFRMADRAYSAGDYATALHRFNTLLGIRGLDETTRSQIEYNIGMCYIRLGRAAEARPYLERYLAAHPDDSEAQARLDEITQQPETE